MIADQGLTVGTVNNSDGIKTCVAENCPRLSRDLRNWRNLRFKIRNLGLVKRGLKLASIRRILRVSVASVRVFGCGSAALLPSVQFPTPGGKSRRKLLQLIKHRPEKPLAERL